MAQVVRHSQAHQAQPDIDYHLDYQFQAWRGIPEYVEWWPDMDVTEKEVFHLAWVGITESRLQQLQQWAEQGLLTPKQRARYEQLLNVVAERRSQLERLMKT